VRVIVCVSSPGGGIIVEMVSVKVVVFTTELTLPSMVEIILEISISAVFLAYCPKFGCE
jgi:hypothetical protein